MRRVGNAIASYVSKNEDPKGLVVGYDTRFASRDCRARSSPKCLPAAGIPVQLADDYTPTPALSYAVKNRARPAE